MTRVFIFIMQAIVFLVVVGLIFAVLAALLAALLVAGGYLIHLGWDMASAP